ncbi:MAG: hypothetical protein FJZ01_06295 [Candidatus Sericytochromatia bacterium]|nr:hypothetical protein [Candidatus Tanganyikabacteria bacterium]
MTDLPVLVGQLHARLDQALGESLGRFAQVPTRCGPGCDACCHYPVQASLAECFVIYRQLPPGAMDRVHAYRDAFLARYAERGEPRDDEEAALLGWGLPCPLLVDGRCSVYDCRPIACRACHSFSDPALCAQVRSRVMRDPGCRDLADQALHLAHQLEDALSLPRRTTLLPFLLYALDREDGATPEDRLAALARRLAAPAG